MISVKQVVIDYGFPEHVVIISDREEGIYWEDVADREAISWNYLHGELEIEID